MRVRVNLVAHRIRIAPMIKADKENPRNESWRIILAATVAGVFAGLGACALKEGTRLVVTLISYGKSTEWGNSLYLFFPFAGLCLSVLYQTAIGENLSRGTFIIKEQLKRRRVLLPRNMMWTPLVGCMLTIGMGCSAGSEGPAALAGAAIGSRAGRWFRLPHEYDRILLACVAGAGIAGIFKSPVGGMLFSIEVLGVGLSAVAAIALFSSCLAGYCTAYVISGFRWEVAFDHAVPFDPAHLGWIALLGIFCGVYSLYYRYTGEKVAKWFNSIRNRWRKATIAGIGMSLIVFLLPPMYGEGYGVMSDLVNGVDQVLRYYSPFYSTASSENTLMLIVVVMLLLKGMAVAATNYGGGVAGSFAPTLFSGALVGYLFATVLNLVFGVELPIANFALIGLAGVMAGVIKAPLMAIFIAAEISDSYSYILGFILVSAISYLFVTMAPKLHILCKNIEESSK